jgi:hypothetical protein
MATTFEFFIALFIVCAIVLMAILTSINNKLKL